MGGFLHDAITILNGIASWASSNAIAAWGAGLSTLLAAREIWQARSRIHFNVNRYRMFNQPGGVVLVTQDVADEGGEVMLVIDVYNRSRDPIHLRQVGLRVKTGGWLIFNQAVGMVELPKKLEPTDGFTMASSAAKVAQTIKAKGQGANHIYGPFCKDGAGRIYKRRFKRGERRALQTILKEDGAGG